MDRAQIRETVMELVTLALTINELRKRRMDADYRAPAYTPFVVVELVCDTIRVSIFKDEVDKTKFYSTAYPEDATDGTIDDAQAELARIIEELSEYA